MRGKPADSFPVMRAIVARQQIRRWEPGVTLHIPEKLENTLAVLPKRRVIEPSFAWLGGFGHLTKMIETLAASIKMSPASLWQKTPAKLT